MNKSKDKQARRLRLASRISLVQLFLHVASSIGSGQTLVKYLTEEPFLPYNIVVFWALIPLSIIFSFLYAELMRDQYKIWIGIISFLIPLILILAVMIPQTAKLGYIMASLADLVSVIFSSILTVFLFRVRVTFEKRLAN